MDIQSYSVVGGGAGNVTGAASSTANAIARFSGTSGKVLKNSGVTIDDNGFMQISVATEQGLEVISTLGAGSSNNLVLIQNNNAAWNRPMLRINDNNTNGGSANIRIDSPGPDIEMICTTQTTPAGKFEIAVNADTFEINGRDSIDSSFEPSMKGRRYGVATSPGSWGVGTLYDIPNAMWEIVKAGSQSYFMCSTAVGGSSGNIFQVNANGFTAIGQSGTPTALCDIAGSTTARSAMRLRSGTAPTSPNDGDFWYDGTNLKIRVGAATKTITAV